ncbi:MAG: energy-coupled thiamine transporter ThiT [Solobacterium sp.]|nr:energy-coupled thiamine transporter ThiT [Solobacterium sp.]
MNSRNQTRLIAYMALYAALYVVLKFVGNYIPFLQMPQGGSIEIELIAIFVASWHLGWKYGIGVAMLSWLITFVLGSNRWYLNPMQYSLDYFLPLIAVGLARLFGTNSDKKYYIGVVVSMVFKFMSNVLSGVYYWPPEEEVAGSAAAWVYSLSYNTWYNLVTCIVCMIVVPLLIKRLQNANVLK